MKISATARFLVRNIVMGNITYLEATNSKAVKETPELKEQIEQYIAEQNLLVNKEE